MASVNRLSIYEPKRTATSPAAEVAQFERLFAQCETDLQAFVFTILPHWSDAEDVVQRTRIVLWRKFPQFRPASDFKAWALQVARLEVCNFRRVQRRDRHCFDAGLVDSLAEVTSNLAHELDRQRSILDMCLRKLRPSDRRIVRQCYGPQATTAKDAAVQLNRPVNTVYKALNRIRRTLAQCVQQYEKD